MTHNEKVTHTKAIYFPYAVNDFVLTFDNQGNTIPELCGRIVSICNKYGPTIRSTETENLHEAYRIGDRIAYVSRNNSISIFNAEIETTAKKLNETKMFMLPGWVAVNTKTEQSSGDKLITFTNGWKVQFDAEFDGEQVDLVVYTFDPYDDIRYSETLKTLYR